MGLICVFKVFRLYDVTRRALHPDYLGIGRMVRFPATSKMIVTTGKLRTPDPPLPARRPMRGIGRWCRSLRGVGVDPRAVWGLRQAQPERGWGAVRRVERFSSRLQPHPAHPELVEGLSKSGHRRPANPARPSTILRMVHGPHPRLRGEEFLDGDMPSPGPSP